MTALDALPEGRRERSNLLLFQCLECSRTTWLACDEAVRTGGPECCSQIMAMADEDSEALHLAASEGAEKRRKRRKRVPRAADAIEGEA